MKIDKMELKRIANEAVAKRKDEGRKQERQEQKEREDEMTRIDQEAQELIDLIPDKLREAAKEAKVSEKETIITAEIMIGINGFLVRAVKKKLELISIPGVELTVRSRCHHGEQPEYDFDYYYIEAKVIIDN